MCCRIDYLMKAMFEKAMEVTCAAALGLLSGWFPRSRYSTGVQKVKIASRASHELRTAVTPISGSSHILLLDNAIHSTDAGKAARGTASRGTAPYSTGGSPFSFRSVLVRASEQREYQHRGHESNDMREHKNPLKNGIPLKKVNPLFR